MKRDGEIKLTAQEIADLIQKNLESWEAAEAISKQAGNDNIIALYSGMVYAARYFMSEIYGGE